jgi:magnesium chelatase family protein
MASLMRGRSVRACHHRTSVVGLIGDDPLPPLGEVSRAHRGVLVLDAFPQCRRHVLAVLGQPLEKSFTPR